MYVYYHINPKVYDFINCSQNKNFKIILLDFDVFIRKLGLIFKLGQLIEYIVRNISIEKVYSKHALKTSAIPLFKACVRYSLTNYFSPNDSVSKTTEYAFYFI